VSDDFSPPGVPCWSLSARSGIVPDEGDAVTEVPAPTRTVLTDIVLSRAVGTAVIDEPVGTIDLFAWLRTMPDREFQRCAPPDHKAAGYTVTDDGRPMSVTVEMIGADLFVHHFVYEASGRDHCRLVSVSDVRASAGWTTCQVIWELRVTSVDDRTSTCVNAVTSHPTAEILRFTAAAGRGFEESAAAVQAAMTDHVRRETPRYAESIGRHANAHG
jgi:hypothetical protein